MASDPGLLQALQLVLARPGQLPALVRLNPERGRLSRRLLRELRR